MSELETRLRVAEKRIKELEAVLRERTALAGLAHAERERQRVGQESVS